MMLFLFFLHGSFFLTPICLLTLLSQKSWTQNPKPASQKKYSRTIIQIYPSAVTEVLGKLLRKSKYSACQRVKKKRRRKRYGGGRRGEGEEGRKDPC